MQDALFGTEGEFGCVGSMDAAQAAEMVMKKIFDENHVDGQCIMENQNRIRLKFGTCSLLCQDEVERREHREKVTIGLALQVSWDSKFDTLILEKRSIMYNK